MFGQDTDAVYRRSQRVTGLPVRPTAVARGLALQLISAGEDAHERRRLGQLLLGELCAGAGVGPVELVVADRSQVHQHDGRRLQSQVNHATSTVHLSDSDIEDIQHHAFDYEQVGFQERLLFIFAGVLGPNLGREP